MIDWEDVLRAESIEELKEAKLWLFQEKERLEKERHEFMQFKDNFLKERAQIREEIAALNRRAVLERKRLKQENQFFEKKMAILQDGFRQLEEDRRSLDRERLLLAEERDKLQTPEVNLNHSNIAEVLFRNASNPLALRKRYRDLVKIFHPDNLFGDEELSQLINKEFTRRKKEE